MYCSTLGCRLFPVLPACNPVSKPLRGGPDLTRRDGRGRGPLGRSGAAGSLQVARPK